MTTFVKGSKQPRETILKHDVLLEKRKKAKGEKNQAEDGKKEKLEERKEGEKVDVANK